MAAGEIDELDAEIDAEIDELDALDADPAAAPSLVRAARRAAAASLVAAASLFDRPTTQ